MSGFRAYCPDLSQTKEASEILLDFAESRHLCGALRAKQKDKVVAFDLSGNAFLCEIKNANTKQAVLDVIKRVEKKSQKKELVLIQSLPKGKAFDDIISVAIQIGVSKIIPIISEHSIVRLDKNEAQKKVQKWQSYVVESIKQSGNLSGLEISAPISFKEFLEEAKSLFNESFAKLVCSLEREKTKPILKVLQDSAENKDAVAIAIGPEGDFSASEYTLLYKEAFVPVSLGENVMKSEVAASFAMSVALSFLER